MIIFINLPHQFKQGQNFIRLAISLKTITTTNLLILIASDKKTAYNTII